MRSDRKVKGCSSIFDSILLAQILDVLAMGITDNRFEKDIGESTIKSCNNDQH